MALPPFVPQIHGHQRFGFWQRCGYGAAGALAHEVVRVYKIYTDSKAFPPFPPAYFVLTGLMLLVGALFSASWEEDKAWKCFYLGVTVPLYLAAWSVLHS